MLVTAVRPGPLDALPPRPGLSRRMMVAGHGTGPTGHSHPAHHACRAHRAASAPRQERPASQKAT